MAGIKHADITEQGTVSKYFDERLSNLRSRPQPKFGVSEVTITPINETIVTSFQQEVQQVIDGLRCERCGKVFDFFERMSGNGGLCEACDKEMDREFGVVRINTDSIVSSVG